MSDPFAPLLARGISHATLAHFRLTATTRYCPVIGAERSCVRYPVVAPTGELCGYHLKFIDGRKPKYRWDGEQQPEALNQVYNLAGIQPGHSALLVEGFPDVWLMHTLGLPAGWLVSGVSSMPRAASIDALRDAAPSRLAVIYDNDTAGRGGGVRVARAIREAGVSAVALALPPSLPEHADVTDLYAYCGQDRMRFIEALSALRPIAETTPAPLPCRAPRAHRQGGPSPYQEFKATHRLEEAVAQATQLKPEAGGRRLVGRCPFHDDATPSFKVYVEDQHAHCFGCGWHGDVITFLESWQRQPARAVVA